jgi:GDP-D-mannose dehydratase
MLQQSEPSDYVLATGVGYTVRDFCELAFNHVGLRWQDHVRYDERYERPSEVDALVGDSTKAREVLGWTAVTHTPQLTRLMVDADIAAQKGMTSRHAATRCASDGVSAGSEELPRDFLKAEAGPRICPTC